MNLEIQFPASRGQPSQRNWGVEEFGGGGFHLFYFILSFLFYKHHGRSADWELELITHYAATSRQYPFPEIQCIRLWLFDAFYGKRCEIVCAAEWKGTGACVY